MGDSTNAVPTLRTSQFDIRDPDQRRRACRRVAQSITDPDDLRQVLEMLDLWEDWEAVEG